MSAKIVHKIFCALLHVYFLHSLIPTNISRKSPILIQPRFSWIEFYGFLFLFWELQYFFRFHCKGGDFWIFSTYYDIQHCFVCCLSDSTVSEDAGIEHRTVATTALAVRRSNHSARSHPRTVNSFDKTSNFSISLVFCPWWQLASNRETRGDTLKFWTCLKPAANTSWVGARLMHTWKIIIFSYLLFIYKKCKKISVKYL